MIRSRSVGWPGAAMWLFAMSVGAAKPAPESAPVPPPPEDYSGIFSAFIENDLFLNRDDNYTSGVGLSWTSNAAETYENSCFVPRLLRFASFLPGLGDPRYRSFAAFTLGQEIYTPTDIESPVPPPDQQPYAGVLFFDTAIYAHGTRSLHDFKLRVGCVGPCSGADQVQTWLHEKIGAPIPQGWDHQLQNELLLNLDYTWDRRLIRSTTPRKVHYDLSARVGGGFGNYYIGANGGLGVRVGYHLPDNYGAASFRTGGAASFVGLTPAPGRGWMGYFFAGVQMFRVVRFLPTDGNTFVDSPSVERDDVVANLATGFVVGYGRILFSWTLNNLGGITDFGESRSDDFGTLAFSYYFGRKKP